MYKRRTNFMDGAAPAPAMSLHLAAEGDLLLSMPPPSPSLALPLTLTITSLHERGHMATVFSPNHTTTFTTSWCSPFFGVQATHPALSFDEPTNIRYVLESWPSKCRRNRPGLPAVLARLERRSQPGGVSGHHVDRFWSATPGKRLPYQHHP